MTCNETSKKETEGWYHALSLSLPPTLASRARLMSFFLCIFCSPLSMIFMILSRSCSSSFLSQNTSQYLFTWEGRCWRGTAGKGWHVSAYTSSAVFPSTSLLILSTSSRPYSAHAFTNWLKSLLLHSENPWEGAGSSVVSVPPPSHSPHPYLLQQVFFLLLLLLCEWFSAVDLLLLQTLRFLRIGQLRVKRYL